MGLLEKSSLGRTNVAKAGADTVKSSKLNGIYGQLADPGSDSFSKERELKRHMLRPLLERWLTSNELTRCFVADELTMRYFIEAILSLPEELLKCSKEAKIPFEDQLKTSLNAFLLSWLRDGSNDNNEETFSTLVDEILGIIPWDANAVPLLLIPNLSCAPFDERPVELNESCTPGPAIADVFPTTYSKEDGKAGGSIALNTCSTIELPNVLSQKARRAEKRKAMTTATASPQSVSIASSMLLYEDDDQGSRSRDVLLEGFDLDLKGRPIITDGMLSIPFGRRLGLIGRNGVGKSTFLRALATRQLSVPKQVKIIFVEQEVHGDETPAISSVMEADVLLSSLTAREKELQELITTQPESIEMEAARGAALAELAKIHTRMTDIGADGAQARAAKILSGLGFAPDVQDWPTRQFSGGWRMRLALARALFCRPDLLLLDEPTNMLDLPSVRWLSSFLSKEWRSSLIVVSHDRDFLDTITTDILHLHHGTLDSYRNATYSSFVVARAERQVHHERERAANLAYRQSLQAFIDRWRYQASRAALAQSKIKVLGKLPIIQPWPVDPPVHFKFSGIVERLPEPWFSVSALTFRYPGGNFSLSCDSFSIHAGARIALVGANGAGKSTFLKIITRDLEPTSGSASICMQSRLRVAYFAQHHVDKLDMGLSALQALVGQFGDPGRAADLEEIRRHLGAFGLSGALALQPIGTLSGGQKSRVVFAALSLQRPHVMVLDEPTNHLDMDAIDALVAAVKAFQGAVVVVSHDVRFLQSICTEIYLCDNNTVKRFPSDSILDYVTSLRL